jgi:hypothetical protein
MHVSAFVFPDNNASKRCLSGFVSPIPVWVLVWSYYLALLEHVTDCYGPLFLRSEFEVLVRWILDPMVISFLLPPSRPSVPSIGGALGADIATALSLAVPSPRPRPVFVTPAGAVFFSGICAQTSPSSCPRGAQ